MADSGDLEDSQDWERVVAEATVTDGVAPLDEATLRSLHHDVGVDWWSEPEGFAAYVGAELSLVVRPSARGRGVGAMLAARALGHHEGVSRAWSHRDDPAAAALAAAHGFARVRELWLMELTVDTPLPDLQLPAGVALHSFAEGDAAELLRVNAAAFAAHPEQGAMDAADLAARMAEPWFDPEGLLLAVDQVTDRLLGFHWTKRVSETVGEVYVVGVDPAAQGRGLGGLVVLAGLHLLVGAGVEVIQLYVESDNDRARTMYAGLGFAHVGTHVMYRR